MEDDVFLAGNSIGFGYSWIHFANLWIRVDPGLKYNGLIAIIAFIIFVYMLNQMYWIQMKQITINIPDKKYSFFLDLIKNLGLEKVKEGPTESNDGIKEQKTAGNRIASLRGKLQLSDEQYKDFHQHINEIRNEWNRNT